MITCREMANYGEITMRLSLASAVLLSLTSLTLATPASATIISVTLTGSDENVTDNADVFGLGGGTITGKAFTQNFLVNTEASFDTATGVSSNSIFDPAGSPFAVSGSLTINGHTFATQGSNFSSIFTTGDYQILSNDPEGGQGYRPGSNFSLDLSGAGLPATVSQSASLNLAGLNFISDTFEDEAKDASRYDAIGSLAPTTLMVTTPVAAVPEPTSWAMMIVGMGMIGGGMRYRRRGGVLRYMPA